LKATAYTHVEPNCSASYILLVSISPATRLSLFAQVDSMSTLHTGNHLALGSRTATTQLSAALLLHNFVSLSLGSFQLAFIELFTTASPALSDKHLCLRLLANSRLNFAYGCCTSPTPLSTSSFQLHSPNTLQPNFQHCEMSICFSPFGRKQQSFARGVSRALKCIDKRSGIHSSYTLPQVL